MKELRTKKGVIGLILTLMNIWEISIHDIFENDKTKLMVIDKT